MFPLPARHAALRTGISGLARLTASRLHAHRSPFQTKVRASSVVAQAGTLESSALLEEEQVRGFKPEHYYPVRIGERLNDRYSVIGKLGYGSASTVWLCRDLHQENDYVALKIYINRSKVHRELPIYEHINNLHSPHGGCDRIRKLLDTFLIAGPHGKHRCLVHEALGMDLEELRDLVPGKMFDPDLVRQTLREILRALHFLRSEARVIHTGQSHTLRLTWCSSTTT